MNIDLLYRLGQTEDRLEEEAARNRALERRGRLLTCQNDRHQILARMIEDYGMEYVQEQIVENPNLSPECCKDPRRLHKPSYCVPPPGVILPQPDWSDGTSSDQEKFWPVPI